MSDTNQPGEKVKDPAEGHNEDECIVAWTGEGKCTCRDEAICKECGLPNVECERIERALSSRIKAGEE